MKTTTRFELVPIEKLVPYVNNARTHSQEQITRIRSSMREFGFVNPVLIDGNFGIIAGHGRYMAAKAEGFAKVPCVFVENLTEAQKKAYILADNRLALDAGWDKELLRVEIESLKGNDFDVELTGFNETEIADLLGVDKDEIEDDKFDVDEELKKPCFSQVGDVWTLGKHKVICGDSTDAKTFETLLGGEKVNLVCTDPPYFVNLESTSGKIKNDDLNAKDAYIFLMKSLKNLKAVMAKDASIYVFYATSMGRIFHDAFEDAGFKVGAGLVWKKNRFVLTRTDWKYIHEPILWGWAKDGKHTWYGDQKQVTVFEFERIKDSRKDGFGHPSSKPVPLIAYLIRLCTQTNGIVLDGFTGSASTLIACEKLGRVFYGAEIEPKFVDVAVERFKEFTGTAENISLLRGGKKFSYDEAKQELAK